LNYLADIVTVDVSQKASGFGFQSQILFSILISAPFAAHSASAKNMRTNDFNSQDHHTVALIG
jgi:hypothetical protein